MTNLLAREAEQACGATIQAAAQSLRSGMLRAVIDLTPRKHAVYRYLWSSERAPIINSNTATQPLGASHLTDREMGCVKMTEKCEYGRIRGC